jgi:predicted transcriptional regulator
MNLLSKFKSGIMTLFAGIEKNNGTTPTTLSQPNLNSESLKNSKLDLQDSGPINVTDNKHKQVYTPTNKYLDNL